MNTCLWAYRLDLYRNWLSIRLPFLLNFYVFYLAAVSLGAQIVYGDFFVARGVYFGVTDQHPTSGVDGSICVLGRQCSHEISQTLQLRFPVILLFLILSLLFSWFIECFLDLSSLFPCPHLQQSIIINKLNKWRILLTSLVLLLYLLLVKLLVCLHERPFKLYVDVCQLECIAYPVRYLLLLDVKIV